MPIFLHIFPIFSTLSGTLGAKQLVVLNTHNISSTGRLAIASSIFPVTTASPSSWVSTTIGVNPAVIMHLRHVFWSILLHITYLPVYIIKYRL